MCMCMSNCPSNWARLLSFVCSFLLNLTKCDCACCRKKGNHSRWKWLALRRPPKRVQFPVLSQLKVRQHALRGKKASFMRSNSRGMGLNLGFILKDDLQLSSRSRRFWHIFFSSLMRCNQTCKRHFTRQCIKRTMRTKSLTCMSMKHAAPRGE